MYSSSVNGIRSIINGLIKYIFFWALYFEGQSSPPIWMINGSSPCSEEHSVLLIMKAPLAWTPQ